MDQYQNNLSNLAMKQTELVPHLKKEKQKSGNLWRYEIIYLFSLNLLSQGGGEGLAVYPHLAITVYQIYHGMEYSN